MLPFAVPVTFLMDGLFAFIISLIVGPAIISFTLTTIQSLSEVFQSILGLGPMPVAGG